MPSPEILQRINTGPEWKRISLNDCKKTAQVLVPGFKQPNFLVSKTDLCIKASTPEVHKSAGHGDSGGPLYLTSENPTHTSLGEFVNDFKIVGKRTFL